MAIDNLVYTELTGTPYLSTDTSITVDDGTVFPAVPFEATIFNKRSNPGLAKNQGEAEIVEVTAIATNTLTITRAQGGTTAIAFGSAIDWAIIVGVTKAVLDGKEDADATILKQANIVNDLTTGGATVPLSAEQGKTLDGKFKILQAPVYAEYSTKFSTTSTTAGDTGLTATITPTKSTSKIWVLVSQPFRVFSDIGTARARTNLLRDATEIQTRDKGFLNVGDSGTPVFSGDFGFKKLDSPATTSAVTYKTQGKVISGTNNETADYNSNSGGVGSESIIILIEVAG